MSPDLPLKAHTVAKPVVSTARGAGTFDDMHDTPKELERYVSLAKPFEWCRSISDEFDRADAPALVYQRWHRRITRIAAFFATLAVGAAIIGLSHHPASTEPAAGQPSSWLPAVHSLDWLEFGFATIAVLAVLIGWRSRCKDNWLHYRHQAESFRLLRYRFLIHPSTWQSGEEAARQWIDSEVNEIRHTALESAVTQPSPHGPFEGTRTRLQRSTLRALTEYYLFKRLNPQKEYLANRTQRNEFSDWIRAYLPWFFFLSIVAVLFKFLVVVVAERWNTFRVHSSERWETWPALLAALLPAAAAGVRTWRSAFEFSRNKGRFEAAHRALRDLERRLMDEGFSAVEGQQVAGAASVGRRITVREEQTLTADQFSQVRVRTEEPAGESNLSGSDSEETDAYTILRDLSWCEHILETEHREWLRLMYETEWFG
jgi:hypothetical protein